MSLEATDSTTAAPASHPSPDHGRLPGPPRTNDRAWRETANAAGSFDWERVWHNTGAKRSFVFGIALCVVGIGVFACVAMAYASGGTFARIDVDLANWLHSEAQSSPGTVAVLRSITALGSMRALTVFAAAVAIYLSLNGQRPLSRVWLAVISGGLLHHALKALFPRERPHFEVPFLTESSSSFPSGHAMASLIGYGLFAYLLCKAQPRFWPRAVVVLAATAVVGAIGFSRLYLGAHYLSDVVAGYAAGMVWLSASISGIELMRKRERKSGVGNRQSAVGEMQ
jgi:membrane-associated phospholipid phosphatase